MPYCQPTMSWVLIKMFEIKANSVVADVASGQDAMG